MSTQWTDADPLPTSPGGIGQQERGTSGEELGTTRAEAGLAAPTRPEPPTKTIRHEITGVSFIARPIYTEQGNADLLQLRRLISLLDVGEVPRPERSVSQSIGYRMRSNMFVNLECREERVRKAWIEGANYDMGWEPLRLVYGFTLTPVGPAPAWLQGKLLDSGAQVISQDERCATFEIRIGGFPNWLAAWGLCEFTGYTPRVIRHRATVRVCCTGQVTYQDIKGTPFPSHSLFVDGKQSQTVAQGPIESLMRIDNPGWVPMTNAEFSQWRGTGGLHWQCQPYLDNYKADP
jgi:hypothetical protein